MFIISRQKKQNIILVFILLAFSAVIFFIQYAVSKNPDEALFLFFQDLAFLPIEVIIVTLVLDNLLNSREKQKKAKKNNVIVCMFFVECGTDIIFKITQCVNNIEQLRKVIQIKNLTAKSILNMRKEINASDIKLSVDFEKLISIGETFEKNKSLLISLLENPNMLEHDTFTDMLWAVFHLSDELKSRESLKNLPETDLAHINVDIIRAYKLLIAEWLDYIHYLHREYPYLHSLAVRKNPFSETQDIIIYS